VHPSFDDARIGYQVDSAAFRQRAPRVMLSDDPNIATQQTVEEMVRQIRQAARDPLVQQCAVNAVRAFQGGPAWWGARFDPFSSAQCMADSCWWWCKHYLRFVHHGSMFEAWSADLGDPRTKLQLLIAPDVLVRMKRMEGDCAIYTMMLCAMLASLGIQFEIVTLAVDQMQPEIFSHVFARAVLPDGRRESLDASHGDYPGWQVPARDIHREWTFDESGRRVGAARFQGLHAYRRRPGRRGMGGTVCDDSGCYDDQTGEVAVMPSSGITPPVDSTTWTTLPSGATYVPSGASVAPAQNSAQWASFASNMLKSGLTLAEINSIQPGTVVSANGAILRQSTGYAVPVGSGVSTLTSSLASGNTIFYLGFGLLAIFAISSMFKK